MASKGKAGMFIILIRSPLHLSPSLAGLCTSAYLRIFLSQSCDRAKLRFASGTDVSGPDRGEERNTCIFNIPAISVLNAALFKQTDLQHVPVRTQRVEKNTADHQNH